MISCGKRSMGRVLGCLLVVGVVAAMSMAGARGASAVAAVGTDTYRVVAIQPGQGQIVGVAHPVTVTFAKPVHDRAAAQRTITISVAENTTGSFTWLNDTAVRWSPDGFWPAHNTVRVLAGGAKAEFTTGAAVVGVADISAHSFTVLIDGQVVREMPASLGKPGFETPIGTFKVLERQREVVFDSRTIGIPLDDPEGYLINGEYAVRVTWGGVYIHSAPWSVGSQGTTNVSHGCINLSPDNAAWYFGTVRVGDPVIVQA